MIRKDVEEEVVIAELRVLGGRARTGELLE